MSLFLISSFNEEAAIYAMCQLDTKSLVTKIISEINFESPARQNDVIEIGVETVSLGRTSITLRAEIRNKDTGRSICKIEKIVFVSVDSEGKPTPHGKTVPKE